MTEKTQHTKGPWEANEIFGMRLITISEKGHMPHADVFQRGAGNPHLTDEDRANAHLIAASPTMFDFIKQIAGEIVGRDNITTTMDILTVRDTARAIIAKAEGRG